MSSPTARTLEKLRAEGWVCDPVERWIPGANIRRDFLGCVDIIAAHAKRKAILGVQATTEDNAATRATKAVGIPRLKDWLAAGARFEVWGWSEVQQRMVKSKRMKTVGVLKVREVRLIDGQLCVKVPPRKTPQKTLFSRSREP